MIQVIVVEYLLVLIMLYETIMDTGNNRLIKV